MIKISVYLPVTVFSLSTCLSYFHDGFLIVKVLIGTFNKEMNLEGAFLGAL